MIGGERFWRIPVMEGEFLVQEKFGMVKGIGGGNFLMLARSADAALAAAEAAADAMAAPARCHPSLPRRRGPEREQGRLTPDQDA